MPADITYSTAIDPAGALRGSADLARRLPAIKLRVDSSGLGSISREATEFTRSLQSANARVLSFAASAGQLYLFARAFREVLKSTIDVQKSLTEINTILNLSQRQLNGFSDSLFKIASETGSSFKIVAQGAIELSRQGLSSVETLKRLKDALILTRLSGLPVEDAVRAITTALNSFNDVALDSTKIIGKLATVDALFAVSSKDLAEGLNRVSSIAEDAGISLDRLLGLLTSAKQISGRTGEVIATGVGTIIQRLNRPGALEELKNVGVLTEDLNGKFLSTDKILVNLAKKFDGLSQSQQNQIAQLVGGVRNGNILRALLSDLSRETSVFSKATDAAANSSDQAARRNAELNKTLSANINETINNLTNLASKVGLLTLEPALRRITGFVNNFSDDLGKSGESIFADTGNLIGQGILKGIGNYLSGPGLALGGILIARLVGQFGGFAARGLAQIIEITSVKYQQEKAINNLLATRPGLEGQIAALEGDQLRIQRLITSELLKQTAELNQRARIQSSVSTNIINQSGYGLYTRLGLYGQKSLSVKDQNLIINPKKAAVGLIPSIQESVGALRGGYTPGAVKELSIKGLGNVIYNSAEKVKQFAGLQQPAIIPPQFSKAGANYNKAFQSAHGFSPYANKGLVPNYAINPKIDTWARYKNTIQNLHAFNLNIVDELVRLGATKEQAMAFKKGIFRTWRANEPEPPVSQYLFNALKTSTGDRGVELLNRFKTEQRLNNSLFKETYNFKITPEDFNEINARMSELRNQKKLGFSSGFSPYFNRGFLPYANKGIIPNYAGNPLISALSREHAAGIPLSQIRVGTSPRIANIGNPLGLGVYNTRDEPGGLSQGISRVAAMGFDPKRAGIPNYADITPFDLRGSRERGLILGDVKTLQDAVRSGSSGLKDSLEKLKKLGDASGFSAEKLRNFELSLIGISRTIKTPSSPLNTALSAANQRYPSITALTVLSTEQKEQIRKKTEDSLIGVVNSLKPKQPRSVYLDENLEKRRITPLPESFTQLDARKFQQNYEINRRFLRGGIQPNLSILNTLPAYNQLTGGQSLGESRISEFNKSFGNISLFNLKRYSDALRFTKEHNLPELGNQLKQTQQSKALIASFVLPALAGIAEQGIGGVFGETRGGRGAARLAGGLGNIASFTATGFAIGGGLPGAAAGLGIGLLSELPSIFKAFNDTLPDLQRNLEKLKESSQQSSVSIAGFIDISEKLSDIYAGKLAGATNNQVNQLLNQKTSALNAIPSEADRKRLQALIGNNNFPGARELQANIEQLNNQRKQAGEFEIFTKGFSEKFPSIENTAGTLRRQSLSPFFNENSLRGPTLTELREIDKRADEQARKSVLTPERLKEIEQVSSLGLSQLFNLTSTTPDKNGRYNSFFNALTNPKNIGRVDNTQATGLRGLKELDAGRDFTDVLREIGKEANIDSEALNKLLISFKRLPEEVKKSVLERLTIKNLSEEVKSRESFIGASIKANRTLSNFNKQLLESQQRFSAFGTRLEIAGIRNLSSLSTGLNQSEIRLKGANQIQLLRRGVLEPKLENQLKFQETLLETKNRFTLGGAQLSKATKGNVFSELQNIQEDITNDLRTKLKDKRGQLSEDEKKTIQNQIKSLEGFFDTDTDLFKLKLLLLRPNNLSEKELNDVDKFFKDKISFLSKFADFPSQLPELINEQAKEKGFTDTKSFLQSTEGKQTIKEYQLSPDIVDFLKNTPTKEAQTIITQKQDLIQSLTSGATKFNKIRSGFTTGTTQLESEKQSAEEIAKTNQETTDKLIEEQRRLQRVFLQGRLDITRKDNEELARNGRFLELFSKGNLSKTISEPLQTSQNDLFKDMANNLQDFSSDFRNAFKEGFGEAIKGTKDLGEALRESLLNAATNYLTRITGTALDATFGALFGTGQSGQSIFGGGESGFIGSLFKSFGSGSTQNQALGGYISKYARGGYVNQGSGTRDDVPAFLSGGEFVLNKRATRRLGKDNLDRLNFGGSGGGFRQPRKYLNPTNKDFSGAITEDFVDLSSGTIRLANSLEVNRKGTKGRLNTSPLLSQFALSDENNPQNKLRHAREQYLLQNRQAIRNYKKALSQFESKQTTSYLIAFGSALANAGAGAYGAKKGTSGSPTTGGYGEPGFGADSSVYTDYTRANGGYVPRYGNGGFFGGDSSSDRHRANIMGGEFVVNPGTVSKYGKDYFSNLNKVGSYAGGGSVSYAGNSSNNDLTDTIAKLTDVMEQTRNILEKANKITNPQGDKVDKNGKSGGTVINFSSTINIAKDGSVKSEGVKGGGNKDNNQSDSDSREQAIKLNKFIESKVSEFVSKEMKSGGALSEKFKSNR